MASVFPTAASPTGSTTPPLAAPPGVGTFPSITLSNEFVKLRFFEPDVPKAINRRWIGMPRGVYLGFEPTVAPASRTLVLTVDAQQNFSLLRVPSRSERVMVDIFTSESIELDFTAHTVWPVYVIATSDYEPRTPTQGKIFTRASNATGIDEVVICKVDKVGDDLVVDVTAPTNRQQPLAFDSQPYGYMPSNAIEDLAATNSTVAEVIAARASSYTGPHPSLGARLNADMSGNEMADRLGLRMVHIISNVHPNRSGLSVNVSGSFTETGREFGPLITISPNGDEATEGAVTDPTRAFCFIVNGSTGQRLVDPTSREPVYGQLAFSTAFLIGTINFVNASTSVNGGGSNPFVSPLQEGDIVQGPDGLFYEIQSIVDPDNAVLGAAYRGTDDSITTPAFRRWLVFLFTVSGGAFNLSPAVDVQFVCPAFFRLDNPIFDGMLLIQRTGERPQLPVATSSVEGKALLAVDGGLVGSLRTVKNTGSSVGNDIHTLNFVFGGATAGPPGVVNVSVPGQQGATGPGANQGPDGPTGAAGFGYSVLNSYEGGPESGDTVTAVGPVSVSFTQDWTTGSPALSPMSPRAYAHVSGGWSIINGFSPFAFERIHIDTLTDASATTTRIDYRIQPDPNFSNTTIACFMGASQ